MESSKGRVFIGTSGWNYWDWKGRFYPEDLPSRDWLAFYAQELQTVEINYSFYHLPRPATFQNWAAAVPENFVFSVKASRFITHIKRLKGSRAALKKFLTNAGTLKEKLGAILFQLPPSFKARPGLLEKFLEGKDKDRRWAFEFRHDSWFIPAVYRILRKYNAALVVADSPFYPCVKEVSADFVYLRFHGSVKMFSSKYSAKELRAWAKDIKKWTRRGDVYAYFNNDVNAAAVENARMLKEML